MLRERETGRCCGGKGSLLAAFVEEAIVACIIMALGSGGTWLKSTAGYEARFQYIIQ